MKKDENIVYSNKKTNISALWRIAYPLMLATLSGNLMLFVDKVLISRFDALAMAAVAAIGMIFTVFQVGTASIVSIAEVFVGKFNGSQEYHKTGPVVWQMIWFSLFTMVVFFPIGMFCGKLFLPLEYHVFGVPYFKSIMLFGPVFTLIAALSSFYIGLGKVKLVTFSTILANFINIILDVILIFGVEPYVSPMGTLGAAIATGISISLQALLLFIFFLQKKYRIFNQTAQFQFSFDLFIKCLKIGIPNSLGYFAEMTAWAILLQLMAYHSHEHIIVLASGQAIFLLLTFTTDGLQKSIIALTSNIIGSRSLELLPKLIKSAIKLHFILVVCFAIPAVFFPEQIIEFFISDNEDSINKEILLRYANITCLLVLFYFVFDGLVWIFAGILIAFEDTKFVMIMNSLSVWLLAILPIYVAVDLLNYDANIIWECMIVYAFINALGFYLRYRNSFINAKIVPNLVK